MDDITAANTTSAQPIDGTNWNANQRARPGRGRNDIRVVAGSPVKKDNDTHAVAARRRRVPLAHAQADADADGDTGARSRQHGVVHAGDRVAERDDGSGDGNRRPHRPPDHAGHRRQPRAARVELHYGHDCFFCAIFASYGSSHGPT